MPPEAELRDLFSNLDSSKKKDVTRGLDAVPYLVNHEGLVNYLFDKSRGDGYIWDTLFLRVHCAVFKIADKTGETTTIRLKSAMKLALESVVMHARGHIKASSIISAVLTVLESSVASACMASSYLEICSKLLQNDLQLATVTSEKWSDLVIMCTDLLRQGGSSSIVTRYFELFGSIVEKGTQYALTTDTLPPVLAPLERLLRSEREMSNHYDTALLHLANVTLLALAADYRYIVIDFVEATTSKVVRMYEVGKDEKNQHIFEFLDLAFNVHHPEGASLEDEVTYSGSWDTWKTQIGEIFHMCEKEVKEVLRNGENSQSNPLFLTLLVDISNLYWSIRPSQESPVFEDRSASPVPCTVTGKRKSTDFMWSQTQKRMRPVNNMDSGIAHVLEHMPSTEAWFWLNYTFDLLKKYPDSLKNDVGRITEKICHMLCEVRDPRTIELLTKCATRLLQLEKDIDDLSQGTKAVFAASWEKVAETSLRNIVKNNGDDYHSVLQALIRHSKLKENDILLDAYLSNTIVARSFSVQTISCVLLTATIEEEKKCELLKWGLQEVDTPLPATNLILSALLKDSEKTAIEPDRRIKRVYCDIYKDLAFKFCESLEVVASNDEKTSVSARIATVVVDCLKRLSESSIALLDSDDVTYEDFSQGGVIVEVVLRVLSAVWSKADWLKNELSCLLQKLFYSFTKSAEVLLRNQSIRLEILSHIYSLDVHSEVSALIRDPDYTTLSFFVELFNFFAEKRVDPEYSRYKKGWPVPQELIQHFEYASDFRKLVSNMKTCAKSSLIRESLGRRNGLRSFLLDATDTLCSFIKSSGTLTTHQQVLALKVTTSLQEDLTLNAENPLHLQMIMTVICAVSTINCNAGVLINCLTLLRGICGSKHKDREVNIVALNILEELAPKMKTIDDCECRTIFAHILNGFHVLIKQQNYNVDFMVQPFVKVIGEVFSADSNFDGGTVLRQDEMTGVLLNLLSHKSAGIRLRVAKLIGLMFSQCGGVQDWQRSSFEKLGSIVLEMNYGDDLYMKLAKSASSLIALGYVFAAVTNLRASVAYCCVKFVSSQNCDKSMIKNFLKLVSKELDVHDASNYFSLHLNHFIAKWLMEGRPIETFPYYILNLNSREEFYIKYTDVIASQCYVNNKLEEVKELAQKLNRTLASVTESALPATMAMYLCRRDEQKLDEITRKRSFKIEFIPSLLHVLLREANERPTFLSAFDAFKSNFSDSDSPLLLELATSYSFSIQKCLLLLETDIVNAVTSEDYSDSFRKYRWFVEYYIESRGNTMAKQVDCYVLRDAVSVALRVTKNAGGSWLIQQSCTFLKTVITCFLNGYSEDVSALLPSIASTLVPIAATYKSVRDFLQTLVKDHKHELWPAIQRLDPFPEESDLGELNAELRLCRVSSGLVSELEMFSSFVGPSCRRIGGLSRLLNSLSSNKTELRALYEKVNSKRGFSDDCHDSLLHQVVNQLLILCGHSDEGIRLVAAKCLGELGPSDLGTLVLIPSSIMPVDRGAPDSRLLDSAVPFLGQLVQQEELDVKKTACEALYAAFRCNALASNSISFFAPFETNATEEFQLVAKSGNGPPYSVWLPVIGVPHDVWVKDLVTGLLDVLTDSHGLCTRLSLVCQAHTAFSEHLLPIILDCIVEFGSPTLRTDLSNNINKVLSKHIADKSALNIKSVQCIVAAVDYLRHWGFRSSHFSPRLNVDYLLIAQAARDCSLHFTSLMFAELWFEQQKREALIKNKTMLRLSVDEVPEGGVLLSSVLRDNYASIGVPDGLDGCGSSHLADPALRVAHLEHLERWDISLLTHDVTRNVVGVARSLHNFGLFQTLSLLPADASTQADCAARLGDWSCLVPDTNSTYQLHHYGALKAYHHQDYPSFMSEIHKATGNVVREIQENKIESLRKIYEELSHLQCLKDLQDFASAVVDSSILSLKDKWDQQDKIRYSEFSLKEPILTSRCIIIKEELKRNELRELKNLLCEQYLKLCQISRREKRYEVCMRNAMLLDQINGASQEIKVSGKIEEARALWGKGQRKIGLHLLSRALNTLQDSDLSVLHSKCLKIYGDWMVETKAENAMKIISDYFMKSISLTRNSNQKLAAYASIAKFADSNFNHLREYLESPQFSAKNELRIQQHSLAINLRKDLLTGRKDQDKQIALNLVTKQSAIDEDEITNLNRECTNFLLLAVRYYLLSLQEGDKYDDFIFRLVSLWLSNGNREDVGNVLKEQLGRVPSHKFLCLLPQIAPRISEVSHITETVERILFDHPHHTLPVLFSLSNSHADLKYTGSCKVAPPITKRIIAANALLQKALKSPELTNHVFQMSKLTDAFIEFANISLDIPRSTAGERFKIPEVRLSKIENLNLAMVPSINLAPSTTKLYDKIVGVHKFVKEFQMVGGINAPKKIVCVGTDGVHRPLLLKGKDDLRQDAVMQQVFEIMNRLLARDGETARRKLIMRTYRVQPLTQRSGVIEWCENTQTLGEYLIGKGGRSGAHGRHHQEDWSAQQCRQIYSNVAKSDAETKLTTYLKICANFKPALHYFFIEKFPTACVWFERRLAYVRSVATSSMIGYILGIGDRHLMNILIDNKTAEAIHIDLGIAFEQGRVLPTPETVPFRLTRDIEDGMGCSGVDGVFRTCCEKTMKVMRENKDTILTLLEVLLYDPLYCWTITPEKAMSMQNRNTDSSSSQDASLLDDNAGLNAMAERALIRLKAKLQGMEQGGVVSTIEGQVGGLIQQARDPANLCRLFQGWQPYL